MNTVKQYVDGVVGYGDSADADLMAFKTTVFSEDLITAAYILPNSSTAHGIIYNIIVFQSSRYGAYRFNRIAIEICCANGSTGGMKQYEAYCKFIGVQT